MVARSARSVSAICCHTVTSLYAVMQGVEVTDKDGAKRKVTIAFRPHPFSAPKRGGERESAQLLAWLNIECINYDHRPPQTVVVGSN